MRDNGPEPDLMAEAAVLSAVFTGGTSAYLDVADLLRVESFSIECNQVVWKCLDHLLKGAAQLPAIDRPSLYSAAQSLGVTDYLREKGNREHVEAVLRVPVEQAGVRALAGKLRTLDIARDLTARLGQAQVDLSSISGEESIDQILALAESPVQEYTTGLSGASAFAGPVLLAHGAREYFRNLIKNPRDCAGIPTGFPRFDNAIGGGLRPGGIELVAARPGIGKSSLANNMAMNITEGCGVPVLYVDTEMLREEQLCRAAANALGLRIRDVELGRLTREQQVALGKVLERYESNPYYHDCVNDMRPHEILSRIRRWVLRTVGLNDQGKANPCVVIYDYIHLMNPEDITKNIQERQALAFLMASLKSFVGKYGVSCIAFAQMNRDGLQFKDSRALRSSDQLQDKVTSLWLMYRKDHASVPEGHRPTDAKFTHELYCRKSRFGEGLAEENYINLATDLSRGLMTEGPTRDELFIQHGGLLKGLSNGPTTEAARPT